MVRDRQIENEPALAGCPSQVICFAQVQEPFWRTSFLLQLHSQEISVFNNNVFYFVRFQNEF